MLCKDCGEDKSTSAFYKRSTGALRKDCKACHSIRMAEYNSQPHRVEKRKETYLKHSRYKLYGLTQETFNQMLEDQSHQCKICSIGIDISCHVDHCHDTGKVRGLLCHKCNCGLGFFKDKPSLLKQALRYLDETTCI